MGDMSIRKFKWRPHGSSLTELAIADKAIGIRGNRRARLPGALPGVTLSCLAVAAGAVAVSGTPAAASCRSATISFDIGGGPAGGGETITLPFAGLLTDATSIGCNASATGNNALAIGSQASVFGDQATAYGYLATATGGPITARRGRSHAATRWTTAIMPAATANSWAAKPHDSPT
jgi:trimeric autotransporter adhesin